MMRSLVGVLVVAVIVTGCSASPATPRTDSPVAQRAEGAAKALTIAVSGEPVNLVLGLGGGGTSIGGSNEIGLAVHQWLAVYDDRGDIHPMLAAELPSRDKGTWVVRPDGTMQTTYRLRPGVSWHDGTPLGAADVAFGWTVAKDPDVPTSKTVLLRQIERIETPDPLTLVMEWKSTYPFASELADADLVPMPVHLLRAAYETEPKEQFLQLPYWTRSFVGVGPYTVAEWEPGSHILLSAYDRYYGGKPKVSRIMVRFIQDPNTAVANLLSGAVDAVLPGTLELGQASLVKSQWDAAGRKPSLFLMAETWRHVFVQFRNPKLPELLDVRARRGLLHAIDRQAIVETLLEGQAPLSYSSIPPDDPKWGWIQDVAVRYDYDPRAAQQLLGQAGWNPGSDGEMVDRTGERVTVPLSTTQSSQGSQMTAIIGDYWKALGLNVELSTLRPAESRDLKTRASFPGLWLAGRSVSWDGQLRRVYGLECPTEATRWAGSSLGCYQNPEMDRIIGRIEGEIDRDEQRRLWRELVKMQSEELPALPLYFSVVTSLFRDGVTGVRGFTKPNTKATWNVAEWDVTT
jgi:peptide/nickel transport system substrate-binding protein